MNDLEISLRDTTAMLNAAIRILRTENPDQHQADISLWGEQVKQNMALVAGAPDPKNIIAP